MHPLVVLAKQTVEKYILEGKTILPDKNLPQKFPRGELVELLDQKAGVFVTIRNGKELRGCIGTYLPTRKNIAEEVIQNAISAATSDYRFSPIQKEELTQLNYSVEILSKPELVKNPKELDPKKYGIIVKTAPIISPTKTDVVFNGHSIPKSGLLLPDLEDIDNVEKQISIACHKGGINPIKEKILIYKFTVEKYQ